jgi:predicted nucleic acid-binding protein
VIGIDTTFLVHLEIAETPDHEAVFGYLQREVLGKSTTLALAPQVLAEFIHVVTDGRRWERPLSVEDALAKAQFWWNAEEVERVYPTAEATQLFFSWLERHKLGRKRLLDTLLAATLWAAGVRSLITSNARDYQIFTGLEIIVPGI